VLERHEHIYTIQTTLQLYTELSCWKLAILIGTFWDSRIIISKFWEYYI